MSPGSRQVGVLLLLLVSILLIVFIFYPVDRTEYGFNMMQTKDVSYGNELTRESLLNMKKTGAESVAFVIFFKQKSASSSEIEPSWEQQYSGLRKSIRWAKEMGLSTGIKPQLLVNNSWSGAIKPDNWQRWFAVYTGYLYELAILAEAEAVDYLVIGTELKQSTSLSYWIDLIERLRTVYSGELSYTAHGLDGLASFRFWNLLDSASVSLYPSLGNTSEESQQVIRSTADKMVDMSRYIPVPVWVAEIGIASRNKARQKPWAWQNLSADELKIDSGIQSEIIGMWLDSFAGIKMKRLLIWAWYSEPNAGGRDDSGYTIQNKPAEMLVSCRWGGSCS